MPQESILGRFYLNYFSAIYSCLLRRLIKSYTDDNTPYVLSENTDATLEKLEQLGKTLFQWFSNSF